MQPAYISCGTAFTKKMEDLFPPLPSREDIVGHFNPPRYSKMPVESVMSSKEIYSVLRSRRHCRKANCVSPDVT